MPVTPAVLEDDLFTMQEFEMTIQSLKLKKKKSGDECGLAAGLLKQAPHALRHVLLMLFNRVFITGDAPDAWKRILFRMLAKTNKAKIPSDFRPPANLRLLYKVFYGLSFFLSLGPGYGGRMRLHGTPPGRRAGGRTPNRARAVQPPARPPAARHRGPWNRLDIPSCRRKKRRVCCFAMAWLAFNLQRCGSVFERCKCCKSHPFLVLEWY